MPQATLPSPRTWASRDLITVPRLRADVANAVAFLSQRPLFLGQYTGGAALGAGVASMGCNAEVADTWGGHVTSNTGSPINYQYWAPVPGWYLCRSQVAYTGPSTSTILACGFGGISGGSALPNALGAVQAVATAHTTVTQDLDLLEMQNGGAPGGAGDYVQFLAYSSVAGQVSYGSTSGATPFVSIRWASALSGSEPLPVPPLTAPPAEITSAWMNANVRDTIGYLCYPPALKAVNGGTGTLASVNLAAAATVPLPTAVLDNYGGFSTSTYTYTVPVAGTYLLYGQVNTLGASTGAAFRAAGLKVGGNITWGDIGQYPGAVSGVGTAGASVTRRMRLTAGETVQLVGAQNSGSALSYDNGDASRTRLIALWEGI